ncbi:MAG TPA: bile acid:sodium symporter [Candidatus Sphingobacterium stercoripullorum]|uniref:Bile acid:sodium symporter n=1 Tax=Candidatus Sphingobacterium stercoripullorum TaxID=2838759 RepID=A0A9D2AYZ0_9SPHI|nr:bile acid:sodium symporter [Candidatus Sphingobacterium stercoripullorum]
MEKLSKYQSLTILIALAIGLVLGNVSTAIADISAKLIVPLIMLMLFGLFLTIKMSDLKAAFMNVRFSLTSLLINFVWTPVFAFILGLIFLSSNLPVWIGFVMLMVTPCTDWYLVFTNLAKGNLALSTAILPINLILQVLLLPAYLLLFFGQTGSIEANFLLESILLVLVVPFLLALVANQWTTKVAKLKGGLLDFFKNSQILFLSLAIMAMFASEGKNLILNYNILLKLLIPIFIFFLITYLLGVSISKWLKFTDGEKVSLVLTTMARNSPISLAIAVSAFAYEPLIAISLVVAPLIELPVLAITSQILLTTQNKITNIKNK